MMCVACDIVDAVKARQTNGGGVPKAVFVVTLAKTLTLLGRPIVTALEEYGFPSLIARTTERVAYP